MEAAFAIAALVVVLVIAVAGLSALAAQIRCIDAAREGARLAARGDTAVAVEEAQRVAPSGALIEVRRVGNYWEVIVIDRSNMLSTLDITSRAIAAAEPR